MRICLGINVHVHGGVLSQVRAQAREDLSTRS